MDIIIIPQTVQIGKRKYEKIYSCIDNNVIVFPHTPKSSNKRIKNNYTYTEEMQERSIRIKAAKKIIEKNKLIDFQRFRLKLIIDTNNEIEFIIFICKQLNNYKPKKNEKINKLVINNT